MEHMTEHFPLSLLDTYTIETQLGLGGGGAVYKALHKRLIKKVVIKELLHDPCMSERSRRNEVEALKNVKNAHLPQIFDYIENDERCFTVMELIEGESFDKLLKRGVRFTQYQVIEWYEQLASALTELHEHGICHSDIKPANIMLTPGGSVCLIDFNAAIINGNDAGFISRSRGYASPEQYNLYKTLKNLETDYLPKNYYGAENFYDDDCTVLIEDNTVLQETSKDLFEGGINRRSVGQAYGIDWMLSDIHNLGATMYHILTGKCLQFSSEGRIFKESGEKQLSPCYFIIERSTHPYPRSRFDSALSLSRTIRSLLT